jgi:hypothetical protein
MILFTASLPKPPENSTAQDVFSNSSIAGRERRKPLASESDMIASWI